MTITKRFQCRICPVSTTFTDEPAAIERLAAKLGWKPAATPAAPQACSNSCRAQAFRDHANDVADGVHSVSGDEVFRRLEAAKATTTTALAEAARQAAEVVSRVRCCRCSHSAELVGSFDGNGMVRPEPAETAAMLGFLRTSAGWVCSAQCAAVLALEAGHAQPAVAPVLTLADVTVARRLRSDATTTLAERRLASTPASRSPKGAA